jgi:molybdopterin converting factor subunit 1
VDEKWSMCRTEKEQESEQCDHQMLVDIKLFAYCRELIGKDKITLKLKNQVTVGDLRKKILKSYPVLSSQIQFVVALNYELVDEITPISSKDVLAILPPVSGG